MQPYYQIALRYGFANYFFQTNQGPSYPAHQFLFSGTSAPKGIPGQTDYDHFASNNARTPGSVGCNGDVNNRVAVTNAYGDVDHSVVPCFDHRSMPSLLDNNVSWKYYTEQRPGWPTGIWTAPNSLKDICGHDANGQPCNSYDWNNKVDSDRAKILTDIQTCNLPQVSWVIPNGDASDHPGMAGETYSWEIEHGPAWVAAIINAVGNSWEQSQFNGQNHQCDYWGTHGTGSKYQPTVIMVVWDDWGGWWDHVDPGTVPDLPVQLYDPLCNVWGYGNTYGFRVPFLLVSAFMAPSTGGQPPLQGYVSGDTRTQGKQAPYIHDFGSILGFIENNFLGFDVIGQINPQYPFADNYAPERRDDSTAIPLADFFCDNSCPAQPFLSIPVPAGAWQATDFFNDTDTSDPDQDAIDND